MTKHINLIADFNTDHLAYDATTGLITNTISGFVYDKANHSAGYIHIQLHHRTDTNITRPIKAHRIAWFLYYGTEPDIIDHQNGCKTDNSISNLISTTSKGNMQNKKRYKNSTLMVGVKKSRNGKFTAEVISRHTNKKTNIGTYHTEKDAHYIATRYKQLHYENYYGNDLTTINGSMHIFFIPNMLEAAVNTIEDTKGVAATDHINSK